MARNFVVLAAVAVMAWPGSAFGQSRERAAQFEGAYAGPEVGVHEHHFYIDETDRRTGLTNGRYYRAWGVGGGAFAGYDLAVAERVRVGLEVGLGVGGNNPAARFGDGTTYTQRPRIGYRATGKVGYLLGNRLLAYGTFGYGGHRYSLGGTAEVANAKAWTSSFTIGAGLQYQLSSKAGVRLDFRHLDNAMSHLLVGIPVRF